MSILGRDLRLWLLLWAMTRWALWCLAGIDVRRTCARDSLVDTSQPVLKSPHPGLLLRAVQ